MVLICTLNIILALFTLWMLIFATFCLGSPTPSISVEVTELGMGLLGGELGGLSRLGRFTRKSLCPEAKLPVDLDSNRAIRFLTNELGFESLRSNDLESALSLATSACLLIAESSWVSCSK